jgi:hypothetical protein
MGRFWRIHNTRRKWWENKENSRAKIREFCCVLEREIQERFCVKNT